MPCVLFCAPVRIIPLEFHQINVRKSCGVSKLESMGYGAPCWRDDMFSSFNTDLWQTHRQPRRQTQGHESIHRTSIASRAKNRYVSFADFDVDVLSVVVCDRRRADVLGIDRQPGGEDGFIERQRTSYTAERVQSQLLRHHSVQRVSLHLRQGQTVCTHTFLSWCRSLRQNRSFFLRRARGEIKLTVLLGYLTVFPTTHSWNP